MGPLRVKGRAQRGVILLFFISVSPTLTYLQRMDECAYRCVFQSTQCADSILRSHKEIQFTFHGVTERAWIQRVGVNPYGSATAQMCDN